MVSASTETINEINNTTFRDEPQRSVLLSMNEQIEDNLNSELQTAVKLISNY